MIPTAVADPAPPPPHPPPQPPRSSFSCDKHPDEQFNGFCPSCLCERLVVLDQSSSNNNNHSSSSRRPSTSSSSAVASIKSLFSSSSTSKPSASSVAAAAAAAVTAINPPPPKPLKPTSFFPELRRTKSFCASKHEAFGLNFSGAFEPQRKSCDVRLRNSLWSLFTQDDESKISSSKACTSTANQHLDTNDSCVSRPVLESKEEDEEEESEIRNESDEIAPVVEAESVEEKDDVSLEIVQEDEEVDLGTIKPMKDHIDNDAQAKKPPSGGGVYLKEIAGSLLSATSVFSKKWQKWRQKQKQRKRNNQLNPSTLSIGKPISRHYRETQSEVADYGFGRRSCDTDPRFSLDAGRISFDDPRYSLDEPRASWDGYFMNGRSFPRMIPPMLSVVEDPPVVTVARTDAYIPVEEPPMDDFIPGGSAQTNEYYSDSSSRRRKSLDRSSSIRKTAAAVVAEMDEMKAISNANVLPASTVSFQGTKVSTGDRDTNSNCISNDYYKYPENFHLGGFRNHGSVIQNREANGPKMSRRWSWKLWGFIHQRRSSRNKDDDEDEAASNRVERSFSESWQDLRRRGEGNGGGILLRSNSSVSWRHSNNVGVLSSGNVRKLGIDINGGGYNRKKKGDECVLERNRSARYSPNNTDNGLLRFYLTPMRNSRRSRSRRGVAATKK